MKKFVLNELKANLLCEGDGEGGKCFWDCCEIWSLRKIAKCDFKVQKFFNCSQFDFDIILK